MINSPPLRVLAPSAPPFVAVAATVLARLLAALILAAGVLPALVLGVLVALVANVLALAASVRAVLVADVLAAAGVLAVPRADRILERPSRAGLIADRDRHRLRVVSGQIAAGGAQ